MFGELAGRITDEVWMTAAQIKGEHWEFLFKFAERTAKHVRSKLLVCRFIE